MESFENNTKRRLFKVEMSEESDIQDDDKEELVNARKKSSPSEAWDEHVDYGEDNPESSTEYEGYSHFLFLVTNNGMEDERKLGQKLSGDGLQITASEHSKSASTPSTVSNDGKTEDRSPENILNPWVILKNKKEKLKIKNI